MIAKSTYNVANAANQALLQAQADFRSLTENLINEFKAAHTPPKLPVIDQVHQAHALTANSELLNVIKELRAKVNALKGKENVNPNKKINTVNPN